MGGAVAVAPPPPLQYMVTSSRPSPLTAPHFLVSSRAPPRPPSEVHLRRRVLLAVDATAAGRQRAALTT